MTQPPEDMLVLVHAITRFIASGDDAVLNGVFARDVTIIENFPPHIFRGPGAVADWRAGMLAHTRSLSEFAYTFGTAQDLSVTGDLAYFVLPVTWTGKLRGRPFEEHGGKSFVLKKEDGRWRIACYAWAVLEMRYL